MRDLKLFFHLALASQKEVLKSFKVYQQSFFLLFLVGILSLTPWQLFGFEENSAPELLVAISSALASLILIVNIILIEKKIYLQRPKERLLYSAPTYLIYTLYSSLLFFIPLFFLFSISQSWALVILPGLLTGASLVMVPVSSVCIDNDNINYFRHSLNLLLKKPLLVLLLFLSTSILEAIPFVFDLMSFSYTKLGVGLIYTIFETFFLLVLTKISVKVFFLLSDIK